MAPKRLERNFELLKLLKKCKNKNQRNLILKLVENDCILCLCECAHNVLEGNLKMSKQKRSALKRFAPLLRELAEKKGSVAKKREFLVQNGGFLPALLTPVIGLASGLIGELVGKLIK